METHRLGRLGAARVQALEQALGALAKIVGKGAAGLRQPRRNRIAVQTDGLRRLGAARVQALDGAFGTQGKFARERAAGFRQPRRNGIAV